MLTLTTVPVLDGLTTPTAAQSPTDVQDVVFTADSEGATVTMFDAHSFGVLGQIDAVPDGRVPQDPDQAEIYPVLVENFGENFAMDLAVSPDGEVLYVSRGFLGDVAAFELPAGTLLWRVPIVDSLRADHVKLSHDGQQLFVSAITASRVDVIDTAEGRVVGSFPTGQWAHGLELSADGRRIFNGSIGDLTAPAEEQGPYALTIADTETLEVIDTIELDRGIRPFVLSPDETVAYAQLSFLHGIVEVDLDTGEELRSADLPLSDDAQALAHEDYPFDAAHHGLALSGDGEWLCAAGTLSDYVALVATATMTSEAIVPVGDEPGWAATSLDGQYCFVTSRGTDTVSVISYADQEEVARVEVGDHPHFVTVAQIPADA